MANQFTAFDCDMGAARDLIGNWRGYLPEGWEMPPASRLSRVQPGKSWFLQHAGSSAHPGPPCHAIPALPKPWESPRDTVMRLMLSFCAELAFSQLRQTFGFVFHPFSFSLESIWMSENRDVENWIYVTRRSSRDKGRGVRGEQKAAFLFF